MEEKEKTGSEVDVVNVARDLRVLQQDFSLPRDTLTSEVPLLEGTIPNAKEVEARLMSIDGSLAEIHKNIEGLEGGMEFMVVQ
eukprot:3297189-Prorocentrum_lima.AAC.1